MKERQLIVIIADDAPEDRAALHDAFSRDPAVSYVVIEAESGERALELRRARKPDCVILKSDLPDMHILDALKKLAAEEGAPACAVVVVVGEGDARLAAEVMKNGAHDSLEKNRARGVELRRAVNQAIERAEQQRRGAANEHELIERNRALEADLVASRREAAAREPGARAWQVARAGANSRRAASRPEDVSHDQTEEQLRLLKTAIAQSNESVVIMTARLDPPGPQIVYVNPTFTKMTGYSPEEVIGETPHILQGPKTDRSALNRLSADCVAGLVFHGEMINYRKDHSEFYLEWTARPVRNERGEVTHIAAAQRDVTESRRVEEELRRRGEEFRSLFDLSSVGMAQVSPEGRYLRVNRKFCQMLGYSEQELLRLTVYEVTHPDDREISAAKLDSSFTDGSEEYSIEKRYVRKDGAVIWALTAWTVVHVDDGQPPRTVASVQDITERKRVETALRESQALNQAALDSLAANVAVLDRDGTIIAVNEAWKRFARENGGAAIADSVGVNYLDVCRRAQERGNGEARAPLVGVQAVLDGARANFTIEYACHSPNEKRWFLMSATPMFGGRGGAVVAHTDITKRKRAEEAILESEARLRQLADAMPQIVYTCGPDGLVDYGNQQWVEYVGVPMEQSVGRKWMEAVHPDDRESTRKWLIESGEKGRPFEIEHRLRRKDGQYRWHLARGTPIRDAQGRIVKWIGTSTDIHDRKEVEAEREELLNRERVARAEAEHSVESIRRLQAVTDSALTHLTLDNLLYEMLARIRELLETDSAAILLLTEDEQSLAVRATIGLEEEIGRAFIPVGQGVAGSIAMNRAPLIVEDLSTVEVVSPMLRQKARSLIGMPLIVEERLIGVIHTSTVRIRRFTEEDVRLLQLAADRVALAIEHARLYEVERQARRQAEESNRVKDEFLAVVSHELRSPLNAILGYAALLRYGGLDAKMIKNAADVIERSGKAQTQLIDDLLDTARIISGKLRLEVGPVDLVQVIEQAIQTIQPAADAKGISIETDLPSEIGQITGDPARLQQVTWNLLSNAVKFTPQGGRVEARLERVDPYIRITVSDTGKGISPDFLPYVFDRFRQADASSARRHGGLGLGLTLVKYLVELHGGTIEAMSAGEGQGATFNVTLPVRAVATPLGETGGAPATVRSSDELSGVRALVVDDEDDARELIEAALTQYGADVVAVSSAAEAYLLITTAPPQERPAVMVTDIGMPHEDGYSLIRRVRKWERAQGYHIPAVALTAYGQVEDRIRALQAGFQMHVAKPVDPAELVVAILSLIKRQEIGEKT
jgi:PAS domain S-box-containing protein